MQKYSCFLRDTAFPLGTMKPAGKTPHMRNHSQRSKVSLYLLAAILALGGGCRGGAAPPTRTVAVTMRKFAISPAEIRLKQDEAVRFEVSTLDVQHGFDVPELGIREPVNPGKAAVFDFKPERKGTFTVECGILCGPGHEDMQARIVVE